LEQIRKLVKENKISGRVPGNLYDKDWVVYAKQPFGGAKQVINYLSRYTHRTAISNDRIINVDDKNVTFTWKDYKNDYAKQKTTLTGEKFLQLFCMHILPPGFTRIRHYGFLSSASKRKSLALIRSSLNVALPRITTKKPWQEIAFERMGIQPGVCRCCGGKLVIIKTIPNRFFPGKRAPPIKNTSKSSNYCMIG